MPCFITATDTSAGKTTFSRLLLEATARHQAQSTPLRVLKPVCCGGTTDLEILLAAQPEIDRSALNFAYYHAAAAPSVAAALEGQSIDPAALTAWCRQRVQQEKSAIVAAEGAGGWMVPLNKNWCVADWAEALGWPVLLVVGERLGCLNPTLLTVRDVERRGLPLAGVVLNQIPGAEPAAGDHREVLVEEFGVPVWGRIPTHAQELPEEIFRAWQAFARKNCQQGPTLLASQASSQSRGC